MKPQNLVDMLYRTVKRYPNKNALLWKEDGHYRGWSYAQLWETIRHMAFGLRSLGVQSGSKVAICSTNGPYWLVSDFAIMSLGAVSVPIYPTLTGKQIRFILENADVEFVIMETPEMVDRVHEWPKQVRSVIVIKDRSNHPLATTFSSVLKRGESESINVDRWGWQQLKREDLATIVHTSGTTGDPKGVMLSHGNLLTNIEENQYFVPVSSRDISLSFLPLSHIFERTCGQFIPMAVGGTIAYAESMETIPQNLVEVKPTVLISVPRLFEKMQQRIRDRVENSSFLRRRIFQWALNVSEERLNLTNGEQGWPVPVSLERKYLMARKLVFSKIHAQTGGRLRMLVSGGAALDPNVARFFSLIGLPIIEGYGMTECSPVIACNPLVHPKPGTVGKPLPQTEVRLAEDGELLVKSPSVMMGYYNQPEETAKTVENGWLHTGDIVEFDEDGYIRIVDRKKNILVLSTGKNVAPQPIENALCSSRYIQQAALVGHKRKYVSALIVPDFEAIRPLANKWDAHTDEEIAKAPGTRELIEREIQRLSADFAPFERPKKFALLSRPFTLEAGELTPTLKVRTKQVEQRYASVIAGLYEDIPAEEVAASTADNIGHTEHAASLTDRFSKVWSTEERQTDTWSQVESIVVTTPSTHIPTNGASMDMRKKAMQNSNWVSVVADTVTLLRQLFSPPVLIGILIGIVAGFVVKWLWF
ncbi:AMP-dependent synthetase/ligase [Polycladomyces subterraneus]|uniref:Long-chain fatty acid--CoA ligase n=1 Tax=Polycladomyces subterraneus TaxID=1016997 RepID=A0ABT8IQE8_9BACL|nr:long-chain fatty acid--CoA ligase [Polycladomyces subterraneus]MDN4595016.1 long-chain fatty acid--CoA ligase [Polycladomyces subterraneus]